MESISYKVLSKVAVFMIVVVGVIGCEPEPVQQEGEVTFKEQYRPQFHYTPPSNWMNDPNGMFYYDGQFFLHHQYNPHGITWGHMSWYQAVSEDMVHWDHKGVAIPEEGNEMIFSGGAIVDHENTSGFGDEGETPIVATYSSHYTYEDEDPGFEQAQSLAYSLDGGETFTKYEGNPVINHEDPDFRDPNVKWHEESDQWVMVVALPIQRKVAFYGSENLREWEHLSNFGPLGNTEGIWECPDLFELAVDGDPGNTKWVLHVDMNPGAIAGGSGSQYFIGDFDGTEFTVDENATDFEIVEDAPHDQVLWTDYGTDFYAAISWSDVPEEDGRRLWVGWMSNWEYANVKPTSPWRSAQSIPRTVELVSVGNEIRMAQQPIEELQQLREGHQVLENLGIDNENVSLSDRGISGKAYEIKAEFDAGSAVDFGIEVRGGDDHQTIIGYNVETEELYVDRTESGDVGFNENFPTRSEAPLSLNNGKLELQILVDWSSVEVFAADGTKVLTKRIFPDPESRDVRLFSEGGQAELVSMDFWSLRSIWE